MKTFLVLLTISAASAVTVYRNDDNMAMETNPKTNQRARQPTEEDQQRAAYTVYQKQERPQGYTKQKQQNQDDQQRVTYGYPKQERVKNEEQQQRGSFYRKQERAIKESKTRPKKYNVAAINPTEQHFENIQQQNNDGHKMVYTSFVQHHDENDATGEGSSDIKKTVPKSSVQFEMFHGPETIAKKPIVIPPTVYKLKNKPKIYHDALNNYKKSKNSFPGSSSSPPILVKDLQATTPSHFTATQPKFQPTFPKRRPYHKRHPESDTLFQAAEDSPTKSDSNPTSHSESNSGVPSRYGPPSSNPNQKNFMKSSNAEPTTERSKLHVHAQKESPLFEIRGPKWTALSDSVEIATSEEVPQKSKRSRLTKEIHPGFTSNHGLQYYQSEHHHQPQPHRFDHDKALRSSTSFGVSNVMFGGELPEDVKQTTLEGGSAFNIAHSYDISKQVEAQLIGASKGPIQFGTDLGLKKIPKHNAVNAGSFEIPVMTEEEYERHFGKYRSEGKKSYRPVHVRQAYDARPKQNTHQYSHQPKQQPLSFSQYNGHIWAQSQNVPVIKQSPNVDMFPSLSYHLPSRRNVSLVPERHGRVLSEDSSEPQQFSVSASYQIDRNHRI